MPHETLSRWDRYLSWEIEQFSYAEHITKSEQPDTINLSEPEDILCFFKNLTENYGN